MSYIHEALIKAQKERHSNYPKDQVQVAETVRLTAKTSWLTLTLLMMLISILVAIIVYSWFKSIQNKQVSGIEIVHQTKPVVVIHPEKSVLKSDKPVIQSDKHKIIKKNVVNTNDEPLKKKIQASIIKQPVLHKESETNQMERIEPDYIENNSSVEKEADDYSKYIIGPGQFLEVSRLYDKGLQYQVQKKYESAITYYKQCLEISPHMAPALNNMGVILLKKKEIQQAKTYFLTAIKESPDYVDPYYNLACLFSQIKDANQAIEYLKMAVQKSPEARNWAITDQDFEPLYELKEFNMIISGY
jgi:tetratricopeptide (TPR) repeat protein